MRFCKKVRKQLNYTQKEFADALDVSYATVNRWEICKNRSSEITTFSEKMQDEILVKMVQELAELMSSNINPESVVYDFQLKTKPLMVAEDSGYGMNEKNND